MTTPSLLAEVLTAKIDHGVAPNLQSYRFQNPEAQMCPLWNHTDLAGRPVCLDSFYTKYAGCNSPLDRIRWENFLRPAYMNYVTQSASGIAGVDADYGSNLDATASGNLTATRNAKQNATGKFGLVSAEAISKTNGKMDLHASNAYQNSQDQNALAAHQQRIAQNLGIGNAHMTRMNHMGVNKLNPSTTLVMDRNADYEYGNVGTAANNNYLLLDRYNKYSSMPPTPAPAPAPKPVPANMTRVANRQPQVQPSARSTKNVAAKPAHAHAQRK